MSILMCFHPCNSLHFGLAKHEVSFPMLLLFIYNFCKLKWCHHGHPPTLDVDINFINNLFQMSSHLSSCFCYGFVLRIHNCQWKMWCVIPSLFFIISKDNGQCNILMNILHCDLHLHNNVLSHRVVYMYFKNIYTQGM